MSDEGQNRRELLRGLGRWLALGGLAALGGALAARGPRRTEEVCHGWLDQQGWCPPCTVGRADRGTSGCQGCPLQGASCSLRAPHPPLSRREREEE
jgi:hypothetical protein